MGKDTWYSIVRIWARSISHSHIPKLHRTNGPRTSPSSNSKVPVSSAYHRKGKRRKDFDLATDLWNNGEPHYLPGIQEGTWSKLLSASTISLPTRLHLTRQWMSVTMILLFGRLWAWIQRGEHRIDDELVFSNHRGYVFHDSRGIESGSVDELEILTEFIQRKCGEKSLGDKLHAIWFGHRI